MAPLVESRYYHLTVFHGVAWYGMIAVAVLLLILCSLLAGLTLALGGLDMTWLRLRAVTGTPKQRKQALVVARIKRHSTWMLCSLILCSVACGESLPFVIQGLWHGNQQWYPIIISTFSMALLAEILPQYIIPRHAISWGYYFWPLIWSCMWFTSILSYPLAWLLDTVAGPKDEHDLFTHDEMAAVIKHHELTEQHVGTLGPDAARIMLGALSLDSREIGGDIAVVPDSSAEDEKDIEKADLIVLQGIIVRWSAVQTIDIEDPVDEAFIAKIKRWSYSRVPVVGNSRCHEVQGDLSTMDYSWEGKRIFGFLHVKNLVGLDIGYKHNSLEKLFVKDLPLYPLPIVYDDMSVYDILNLFQLGMSRMAVIVPRSLNTSPTGIGMQANKKIDKRVVRWTATERTTAHIVAWMKEADGRANHTAESYVETPIHFNQNIVGVNSPKPVGIVTFEDVIDAILQKTSRDEKDFFDRDNISPPTKNRKAGDFISVPYRPVRKGDGVIFPRKTVSFQQPLVGTLRRRNVSAKASLPTSKPCTMDGANDNSGESTYIESAHRDFHEQHESAQAEESIKLPSRIQGGSLPSRKVTAAVLPDQPTSFRHVSAEDRIPHVQQISPFSRHNYLSFPSMVEKGAKQKEPMDLAATSTVSFSSDQLDTQPRNDMDAVVEDDRTRGISEVCLDESRDRLSLQSRSPDGLVDVSDKNAPLGRSSTEASTTATGSQPTTALVEGTPAGNNVSRQPYSGFPPELLDLPKAGKENRLPCHISTTLPRMIGSTVDISNLAANCDLEIVSKEDSFHDDRALLPSQKRAPNSSVGMTNNGTRSSSYWF